MRQSLVPVENAGTRLFSWVILNMFFLKYQNQSKQLDITVLLKVVQQVLYVSQSDPC